jgi:hypothetical protein
MAKIKMGERPKTFKPFPVKVTMPDGTEGEISATFVYRTQEEYGELLNDSKTKGATPIPMAEDGSIDFKALYSGGIRNNAEFLLTVLSAWDLEEPLTAENLQALGNELPAAVIALQTAYGLACREGRLGN